MKFHTLIVATVLLSANAFSATVVDVTKIAGKSQAEVAKLLGAPTSCSKIKHGKQHSKQECFYTKGASEIVFINKKADWITIQAMDSVPFNKSALQSIGLPPKNLPLKVMSFFGGLTFQIYVKFLFSA